MSDPHLRAARAAVGGIFALNGALLANWIARIPAVKGQLALSDADLGLALLGLAVGALLAFPVAGWSIARFGSRRGSQPSGPSCSTTNSSAATWS